jgi:hypothetical protein
MRFQKASYSDYLQAAPTPEPSPADQDGDLHAPAPPELAAARTDPYDLLDAADIAERLESLCAARRTADRENPAVYASAQSAPSATTPGYDLLPEPKTRRRRGRAS